MIQTTKLFMWGWLNSDGNPQLETFPTPDEAIVAMFKRIDGAELIDIYRFGFKLACMEVCIKPEFVLEQYDVKDSKS